MKDSNKVLLLLEEWKNINARIDNIDARIWQGAGILLIISVGGFSLVGWSPSDTWFDLLVVGLAAIISIAVLIIWLHVFNRWIYVQSNLGYRAREIEQLLDLRYNRYSRIIEYWDKKPDTKVDLQTLKENYYQDYLNLEKFYGDQIKKKLGHTTIRTALRALTYLLMGLWLAVFLFHILVFCIR